MSTIQIMGYVYTLSHEYMHERYLREEQRRKKTGVAFRAEDSYLSSPQLRGDYEIKVD